MYLFFLLNNKLNKVRQKKSQPDSKFQRTLIFFQYWYQENPFGHWAKHWYCMIDLPLFLHNAYNYQSWQSIVL